MKNKTQIYFDEDGSFPHVTDKLKAFKPAVTPIIDKISEEMAMELYKKAKEDFNTMGIDVEYKKEFEKIWNKNNPGHLMVGSPFDNQEEEDAFIERTNKFEDDMFFGSFASQKREVEGDLQSAETFKYESLTMDKLDEYLKEIFDKKGEYKNPTKYMTLYQKEEFDKAVKAYAKGKTDESHES